MILRLPVVSGKKVIKALGKAGFKLVKIKGSHAKLKKDAYIVIVPLHDELSKGTLLAIIRQAGLTKQRFLELLKDP